MYLRRYNDIQGDYDSVPECCVQIKGISRGGFGFIDLCENTTTHEYVVSKSLVLQDHSLTPFN